MNRRFIFALVGAVLCGLTAILLVQSIIQKKINGPNLQNTIQVVKAKTRIPMGTTITADMLKKGVVFNTERPEGAVLDFQQVAGKVAITDIEANVDVTTQNTSDRSGPEKKLDPEKRAISIRVDEASGVAGFATPGSYVDVIAVMTPGNGAHPVSTTIAQNLRVVASGRETQIKSDNNQNRVANTVTLEVTPGEAQTLTLAMREGTLHLMLRNPANHVYERPLAVVKNDLVEDKTAPVIPRPTPASTTIYPNPSFPPTPTPKVVVDASPTPSPSVKMAAVRVFDGEKASTVMVKP